METDAVIAPPGPPLSFRGRLDEADVGHIRWYQDLLFVGRPVRFAAATALTLAAGAAVWWSVWWGYPSVAALFGLIWFYFVFGFARERRWTARRAFRRRPADYLETLVTLSGDRVSVENELGNSSCDWKVLGRVVTTPHGLLFCDGGLDVMFWLPERLLGDGVREQVLGMVAGKGIPVGRLS